MSDSRTTKPQAFVIMPFGEGFDEIYGLFIAGAVSEAGYDVVRADDIRSQQNILKDIVDGLADSSLVIADLTGSNPNVYYELGLAHGLSKRVILLTQHVDELPFDLRSYRVIPYSTHFAEIAKARAQLLAVAKDALDDRLAFGTPVTDFLSATMARKSTIVSTVTGSVSEPTLGEAGVLDHLVDMEEGFAKLGEIIETNNAEMTTISKVMSEMGERLTALAKSNSPARTRWVVVITLANQLLDYAKSLATHNGDYATTLDTTRSSLESLIRAQTPSTETEKDQLKTFLTLLDRAEESALSQRSALTKLIEIIRSTPRVERTFNRAAESAVRSLEGYAQNVDQTLSMIVRARQLTKNRLGE
ncbi:MAG: hypothetical protein ACT4PN_14655 [Nitrospiraceae bacterium]